MARLENWAHPSRSCSRPIAPNPPALRQRSAVEKGRSFLPCTFGKNDVHRRRPILCRILFFATLALLLVRTAAAAMAARRLLGR
ncbi:MAG: hypothetical protein LBT98_02505 [Puniceicoccales bacterium]|nr:hypothetical protein [Puniceicoccales bacterium]